jgi:hypothetical protein
VPVPARLYPLGTSSYKQTFYICDSPGFEDSAGVEVDIANGVGLVDALAGCRSLRLVLLLPYTTITANRSEGLGNISKTLSSLFAEIDAFEASLIVLFNKVPKSEMK